MSTDASRRFATRDADESFDGFAARVLPDQPLAAALDSIRAWNPHVFARRRPAGEILGSDVVFVEPPLAVAGGG